MTPSGDSEQTPRSAARPPEARRQAWRAFTLMELMLVISAIAMLLIITLPAVTKAISSFKRKASQGIISQLANACEAYETDFGAYPPSYVTSRSSWRGSQLLTLLLTGYFPDSHDGTSGLGEPGTDALFGGPGETDDDGKEGFGFRVVRGGRQYGPYMGTDRNEFMPASPDDHPVFVDAFGNEVFYYRYETAGGYDADHNRGGDIDGPLGEISGYADDPDGGVYRKDFLLITAGADGDFTDPTDVKWDDITNFFLED